MVADMKRDMELIRLLLLEQELGEALPELSTYTEEAVLYNYKIMADAELIEARFHPDKGVPANAIIYRLTWAGHDFLDSSRDSKIWKLAKEQILKPGASWTFSLLVEWLKQEARNRIFGVPPSS